MGGRPNPVIEEHTIKNTELDERRVPIKPVIRETIPTWNLPVERMKHLAKVTRLLLNISSVQLTQLVSSKIMQKENKKLQHYVHLNH